MKSEKKTATLLITCPDQRGLVSGLSSFLFEHHANILHADQHIVAEEGLFLMRVEWDLRNFSLDREQFQKLFDPFAKHYQMKWKLTYSEDLIRVALFVSKQDHCLMDLLHRHRNGELLCEIPVIISNHEDNSRIADFFKIPFAFTPTHGAQNQASSQAQREEQQIKILIEHGIQLCVLARYMQILSPQFIGRFPNHIINIHHSFLPAFVGAKPYHQAYERGVKIIGATSHYVTQELDEGPIIAQEVAPVTHRDSVDDLICKGRDLEKVVLSRSLKLQLENRILIYGGKTVVLN